MSLKLNVIDREGKLTSVDIEEGTTIRDAIEENLSPDNYGVCGGSCICSTCHIYINPNDRDKLPSKKNDEITTLESMAVELKENSRLGCQVDFKKEYDNITVTIASD